MRAKTILALLLMLILVSPPTFALPEFDKVEENQTKSSQTDESKGESVQEKATQSTDPQANQDAAKEKTRTAAEAASYKQPAPVKTQVRDQDPGSAGSALRQADRELDKTGKKTEDLEEVEADVTKPVGELQEKINQLVKQQGDADSPDPGAGGSKASSSGQATGTAAAPEKKEKKKTLKLYGRLEQISAKGDVKMPVLKAMTPKLDPRGKKLKGDIDESKYSGTIAKQFPIDFRGQWGGVLKVWNYHYSPAYLKYDRQEAIGAARILRKGRAGNVNFYFYRTRTGRIALKPADVLMSVPMKDTYSYGKMMKSSNMNSQLGPFGGTWEKVMANMEVPAVKLEFGNVQSDGVMVTGVSGNKFSQKVVKNVIRQLAANVVEQQIIAKVTTVVASTGQTNHAYDESVLRFKKLRDGRLYVLAASVRYSASRKYLRKLIMYGTVQKGRVVQTNPMGDMNSMMGNMMNMQGLQSLFGGSGGPIQVKPGQTPMRMPQMQGMPKNFNPADLLKQMGLQQR